MSRDESPFGRPEETRPIHWTRSREAPGLGLAVAAVVAVVALVALGYWLWRERRSPPPEAGASAPAAPTATAPEAPAASSPARALPALDASDALVRELAAALSSHPQLAAWLVSDELVRRYVAAVVNLAEGTSPASHLDFLRPHEPFRARRSGGRWFVDPDGSRRYDLLTEVLVSLDAAGAARLHAELHPLLDQAYGELGDPTSSFDATLGRALGNLLAVPIPEGTPELVPQGTSFHWADRRLESLSAAEKHLLRFGPENARRVQAKLRELGEAAGIALR
jgi:hypothetical protein